MFVSTSLVIVIFSAAIPGFHARDGNLTFVPLETGAACLDGSPYGYYFVPSEHGSTKWTVSLEGGGWCVDEASCAERAHTSLGSTTKMAKQAGCACMNIADGVDGINTDCNCVYLPYCDGASFSGYREKVWSNDSLTFRGIVNLDATIDIAFAKLGLNNATEFVLTGGSAGGLATFLHADRVAAKVKSILPHARVTAAPVVGYFLDHLPYTGVSASATTRLASSAPLQQQDTQHDHTQHEGSLAYPHNESSYGSWMSHITNMQNLTGGGGGGGLMDTCLKYYPTTPHFCFMSPHMAQFVETPLFMFNSKVDAWQMLNDLQMPCYTGDKPATRGNTTCNTVEQKAVVQYGHDFLTALAPISTSKVHGAFITSCICHGCPWPELVLENKTAYELYAMWYKDTSGSDSHIHIDEGDVNGGGALTKKFPTYCLPFP